MLFRNIDLELFDAAVDGHTETAERLIKAGADINAKDNNGITALMFATGNGHTETAERLIKAGADVNAKDNNGFTALMFAANNGHTETAERLIKAGADVNAKDNDGSTALGSVVFFGHTETAERLIKAGADVNAKDNIGWTALILAAAYGHTEIAEMLIKAGVDVNAKHNNGLTALDCALENGNAYMIDLIKKSITLRQKAEVTEKRAGISENDIHKLILKSLFGMIGLENFSRQFSIDLYDFIKGSGSQGRIFWGNSGTGKTEFAQRIAGMKDGIPQIDLGIPVFYVSGVDGKFEVKGLVDQIEDAGIVFIDEADKCLDPSAQMVSKAEATQIQYALVTHFSRKKVYWVFLGTFNAIRNGLHLTSEMLEGSIGQELSTRLDFFDWAFPDWTLEHLLKAVKAVCSRRNVRYEDEALMVLSEHCLKRGGGVRTFDNLDQMLNRKGKMLSGNDTFIVTRSIAEEVISKLG